MWGCPTFSLGAHLGVWREAKRVLSIENRDNHVTVSNVPLLEIRIRGAMSLADSVWLISVFDFSYPKTVGGLRGFDHGETPTRLGKRNSKHISGTSSRRAWGRYDSSSSQYPRSDASYMSRWFPSKSPGDRLGSRAHGAASRTVAHYERGKDPGGPGKWNCEDFVNNWNSCRPGILSGALGVGIEQLPVLCIIHAYRCPCPPTHPETLSHIVAPSRATRRSCTMQRVSRYERN